jgi:predicted RNase H-like nuclease
MNTRAVLGIDAAWTTKNPSGVALLVEEDKKWKLISCAISYKDFTHPLEVDEKPTGEEPDFKKIIEVAGKKAARDISIVALDMPLSKESIEGRRKADQQVSIHYGARGAGTHTPNKEYAGFFKKVCDDLDKQNYPLITGTPQERGAIEVYPHPALIELTKSEKRLPYKVDKIGRYWKDDTREERRKNLFAQWQIILDILKLQIPNLDEQISLPKSEIGSLSKIKKWKLKAFEDQLDAVICAWVGVCFLDNQARAYGDETAAIWIPELND